MVAILCFPLVLNPEVLERGPGCFGEASFSSSATMVNSMSLEGSVGRSFEVSDGRSLGWSFWSSFKWSFGSSVVDDCLWLVPSLISSLPSMRNDMT